MSENVEFSHTILHGENILKQAALPPNDGLSALVPPQSANAVVQPPALVRPNPTPPQSVNVGAQPSVARVNPAPIPNPFANIPGANHNLKNAPVANNQNIAPVFVAQQSEMEKLKAEADKMKARIDQITKERNAAIDAERKRIEALREKERQEIHKMQLEKEAREKLRREERALKLAEQEKKKAAEAARIIQESKDAAEKRRLERDRPWAQPQKLPKNEAAIANGAPAWMAKPQPARAPSPSNAVRAISPRNISPVSAVEDSENNQYLQKLRERLKAKEEENAKLKRDNLAIQREREKEQAKILIDERARRDQEKIENAKIEAERVREREQRAAEQRKIEKRKQEENEEKLRIEKKMQKDKLELIRIEREKLKLRDEEVKRLEREGLDRAKKLDAERKEEAKKIEIEKNNELIKEKLRKEKEKIAERIEQRELDRKKREQERLARLNNHEQGHAAIDVKPSALNNEERNSSSSEEENVKVKPQRKQQPSPGIAKHGALKLDWLSNLEQEMGAVQNQIERLQTPKGRSPHSRVSIPSSDEPKNIGFLKKDDRKQISSVPHVETPNHTPSPASHEKASRVEKKLKQDGSNIGSKSPRQKSNVPANSKESNQNAVPRKKSAPVVSISYDNASEPPWRKQENSKVRNSVDRNAKKNSPPASVEESASVMSADDAKLNLQNRKHRREEERVNLQKFLQDRRKDKIEKFENNSDEKACVAGLNPLENIVKEKHVSKNKNFQVKPPFIVQDTPIDDMDVIVLDSEAKKNIHSSPIEAPTKKTVEQMESKKPNISNQSLVIAVEDSNLDKSVSEKLTDKKSNQPVETDKGRRPSLTKMIANLFGSKEKRIVPGVSPKIKLQSPKIKILSPKIKNSRTGQNIPNTNKASQSHDAWALNEDDDKNDNDSNDKVFNIAEDPKSWSSEVNYNGTLNLMKDAPLDNEYQDLLDSMRLALQDAPSHVEKVRKHSEIPGKMSVIPEASSEFDGEGSNTRGAVLNMGESGEDSIEDNADEDDETFEESSLSSEDSAELEIVGDEDANSDGWSVNEIVVDNLNAVHGDHTNSGQPHLKQDVLTSNSASKFMGKPLSYYAEKRIVDSSSSNRNLNDDFVMEEGQDVLGQLPNANIQKNHDNLKQTLFGVPVSLSASIHHDMAAFSQYGPSVRIETLRIALEERLGEKKFMKAYRYLKKIQNRAPTENEIDEQDEEEKLLDDMEKIVGTEGLKYLDLLYELITAEDNF